MRWLFRFAVYFVKPIVCTFIVAYFGYQTLKAVCYAVSGYEKAKAKEEIKAREKLQEFELKQAAKAGKEGAKRK